MILFKLFFDWKTNLLQIEKDLQFWPHLLAQDSMHARSVILDVRQDLGHRIACLGRLGKNG